MLSKLTTMMFVIYFYFTLPYLCGFYLYFDFIYIY